MDEYVSKIIDPMQIDFLNLISNKENYIFSLKYIYKCFDKHHLYDGYIINPKFIPDIISKYLRNGNSIDFIMKRDENYINVPWFSLTGYITFCKNINDIKSTYMVNLLEGARWIYGRILYDNDISNYNEMYKAVKKTIIILDNKFVSDTLLIQR
jgi:hypothetical protein